MATNVSQFLFYDTNSTLTDSNIFGNSEGASSMTIQVMSDNDTVEAISVLGSVDMQEQSFQSLRIVSLETFKKSSTITKPGIYLIITSGVNFVKLHRDNAETGVKVFAIAVA